MKLTRQLTFRSDRQTSELSNPLDDGGTGTDNIDKQIYNIFNKNIRNEISTAAAILPKPELCRHSNEGTQIDLDALLDTPSIDGDMKPLAKPELCRHSNEGTPIDLDALLDTPSIDGDMKPLAKPELCRHSNEGIPIDLDALLDTPSIDGDMKPLAKPELCRHSNEGTPIDLDALLNIHQSHCVSGCLLCISPGFHESNECIQNDDNNNQTAT
jgi:hypothetical protein